MKISTRQKLHARLGGWFMAIGFFIAWGAAGSGDAPGTTVNTKVLIWGGLLGILLMGVGLWFLNVQPKIDRQRAIREIKSWYTVGYPIERWWA